ncbi:uncharacterized protein LOC100278436 [Zea mays]|uniref:uncharacterized protein LOC100278436 n=1 Tax=Zea mays TaxID=4577 RepID=UPI000B8F38D0|nr:uncharacterized protein LOC100278436 [Zea mays]|eukprot:NP_001145187.2 uncharacterized protein LOC100278436 [Zea mays]
MRCRSTWRSSPRRRWRPGSCARSSSRSCCGPSTWRCRWRATCRGRASRSAASRPSTTPSCGATRPPAPGPSRRGATGTPRSAPCRGRARMPPSRVLWPCSSTSPTDAACFHSHSARTTYRAIRSVACVLATSDLSIFLRILALGV